MFHYTIWIMCIFRHYLEKKKRMTFTFMASSNTTTCFFLSHCLRIWTVNSSKCSIKGAKESNVKRLEIWRRRKAWCSCEEQSMLCFPSNSPIDFIYLLEKSMDSDPKRDFATFVLEINTCVCPNMLVLKQSPYLHEYRKRGGKIINISWFAF